MRTRLSPQKREAQLRVHLAALVAECGIDALTVRGLAGRAGVSVGAVQRYFPSGDAMLAAVFDHVTEAMRLRIEGIRKSDDSTESKIRAVLQEMLPLNRDRSLEVNIWLAVAARAAVTPELRSRLTQAREELESKLVASLRPTADGVHGRLEREVAGLLAVVDGLAVSMVSSGSPDADTAIAVLDRQLQQVITQQ